ncbi:hypothetical protein Barb4_04191 [Bacteroidales bacterium Barb4]|nr:hypothetical protein Barb4_04191 [Bacteroidales bacterium Barb4]
MAVLRAGELRHRINIWGWVAVDNPYGGKKPQFVLKREKVLAGVYHKSGAKVFDDGGGTQVFTEFLVVFTIRMSNMKYLDTACKIEWENSYYRIADLALREDEQKIVIHAKREESKKIQ